MADNAIDYSQADVRAQEEFVGEDVESDQAEWKCTAGYGDVVNSAGAMRGGNLCRMILVPFVHSLRVTLVKPDDEDAEGFYIHVVQSVRGANVVLDWVVLECVRKVRTAVAEQLLV